MPEDHGLVYCLLLNGDGAATELTEDIATTWRSREGTVWYHMDITRPGATEWLLSESGLSELTVEMLTSQDTRPRLTPSDGGMVICLRAVNHNPGSDPDDMVSLRLWASGNRIFTMRRRRVEAINDIKVSLERKDGPTNSASFLSFLCERLTDRIATVVSEIDEGMDQLEDEILEQERVSLRAQLLGYRRMIIGLRRYVVPQREALTRLQMEPAQWLSDMDRLRLRESTERTARCIDDLDSARDRAAVAQEELNTRLSEHTNRVIYMMSVVATIFLPLGLITGLLGINVGGVPGATVSWAFYVVCGVLVVIAGVLYLLFRRRELF